MRIVHAFNVGLVKITKSQNQGYMNIWPMILHLYQYNLFLDIAFL